MTFAIAFSIFIAPLFVFCAFFSVLANRSKIEQKHYWLGIGAVVLPWVVLLLLSVAIDEISKHQYQNFLTIPAAFLIIGIPGSFIVGAIIGLVFRNDQNRRLKIFLSASSIVALVGILVIVLGLRLNEYL